MSILKSWFGLRRSAVGNLGGPGGRHPPAPGAVRRAHIEAALATLSSSAATRVRYLATLKSAWHDALREGLITVNPATLARVETGRRPKVHPLEPDELGRPLDHVAADELGPLYELIAASGLRRGEALALTWDAVDLENRRLTPQRQVVQLSGEHSCSICGGAHVGLAFTKPKTSSGGGRRVDFDPHTVGLLLGHQLAQDAHREACGDGYADHRARSLPARTGHRSTLPR